MAIRESSGSEKKADPTVIVRMTPPTEAAARLVRAFLNFLRGWAPIVSIFPLCLGDLCAGCSQFSDFRGYVVDPVVHLSGKHPVDATHDRACGRRLPRTLHRV